MVLLADSNDIVWLPCGRDLVEDFHRLGADVVLGHSEFNYPDAFKEPLFPDVEIQDPATPFTSDSEREAYEVNRFINAGVIMGRVRSLEYYIAGTFLEAGYVDRSNFDDQT